MATESTLQSNPDSLLGRIYAANEITADDVAVLRRDVFADSVVTRIEAHAVFDLDGACERKDPAWAAFYVDALTDYFVWRQQPAGYLSDDDGAFLIDRVTRDGRIDGRTEMELVVNVCHWARQCPDAVVDLALRAVKETVLGGGGVLFGPERRRPGVIDRADVEIIRKLIYAGGSGGGLSVTRLEAEFLFDLNDATVARENAETWQELFVKAVASHLMFPRGAPVTPSADEASRREEWLKERRGIGRLLAGVVDAVGPTGFATGWAAADLFGARGRETEAARAAAADLEAAAREAIDEVEAAWLVGRIGSDDVFHDNERALLAFIKANAPTVHPTLMPLMARAGL